MGYMRRGGERPFMVEANLISLEPIGENMRWHLGGQTVSKRSGSKFTGFPTTATSGP
jgi:hypothetical protein